MKFKFLPALILLVSISAHAEPASTESIEELLVTTKAESLINSMYANMEPTMRQVMNELIKGKTLDAKQKKLVESMPAKISQVMRDELSWSSIKPMYVQIYKESFTQEEVDGVLAFYKSPAGIAMIDKMPLVMQKSMAMMQQRMMPLMEKMEAAMNQSFSEAGVDQ